MKLQPPSASESTKHTGDRATAQNRRDKALSQILPRVKGFADLYSATAALVGELGIDLNPGAMLRVGSIDHDRVAELNAQGRIVLFRDVNPFNPATVKALAKSRSISEAEAQTHIARTMVARTGTFYVQTGTHDGPNAAEADRLVIFGTGGYTHTAPIAATETLLAAGYTQNEDNTTGGLKPAEVVIGPNKYPSIGDQFTDALRPVALAQVQRAWE